MTVQGELHRCNAVIPMHYYQIPCIVTQDGTVPALKFYI